MSAPYPDLPEGSLDEAAGSLTTSIWLPTGRGV